MAFPMAQYAPKAEVFIFTQALDGWVKTFEPVYRFLKGGMDHSVRRTTEHWGVLVCPPSVVPTSSSSTYHATGLNSSTFYNSNYTDNICQYVERQLCAANGESVNQNIPLGTSYALGTNDTLGTSYELDKAGKMTNKSCRLLVGVFDTNRVRQEGVSAIYHLGQTNLDEQLIAWNGASHMCSI